MLCVRSKFNPLEGPLVKIGISSPDVFLAEAPHKVVTVWALIDTGADLTCIFSSVAEEAEVLSFEKRDMMSASHATASNIYIVNLQIHLAESIVELRSHEVVEFAGSEYRKCRALLGRDVLCMGESSFSMASGAYELCLDEVPSPSRRSPPR
jgi:predicted aspartyl protease